MQVIIRFSLKQPLRLPLAYHHILQGFIYHRLKLSPEYAATLHNHGYQGSDLRFKLFVFSLLQGRHTVAPPFITFYDEVSLEVRSVHKEMIQLLLHALVQTADSPLRLGNSDIYYIGSTISHQRLTQIRYHIHTLSPITLSRSVDTASGTKTVYLSLEDEHFSYYLTENLNHKLLAYGQNTASAGSLTLIPKRIKKYVTTFGKNEKKIYITGWSGSFILSGAPDALSFLYDAGLGARNSQGFGMFATNPNE